MKSRFSSPWAWAAPLIALGVAAGCGVTPISPRRDAALSVTLQRLNTVSPALLAAASNEVYFHLDGTGAPPGHGVYGPFTTSTVTGSVTITLRVPPGPQVLSLQLNNASNHQPLALGAVSFDIGAGLPAGGLAVDMGSVTRNCYYTDMSNVAVINTSKGGTYTFATDTLAGTPIVLGGPDVGLVLGSTLFFIEDAYNNLPSANVVAFMGKGEMVDYDGVPPDSHFFPYSYQSKGAAGEPVSFLETGDVYCVKPHSLLGGYAWLQITDPGVANVRGPNFRFRVNTTKPFYSYEQTAADTGNNCGTNY